MCRRECRRKENNDKKDEIALVIDYCDYSSLNSCVIYSLCNNNWKIIKHFTINETSFDYIENEKLPVGCN